MNGISATPILLFSALVTAAIDVAPSATLFENDKVKVVRALEKTHVKGAFHEHKVNRVMIYLQAGRQRFEYQDGRKPAVFDYKAGEVKWSPPEGMHAPEVLSDEPFNIIEVELKKPGTGKKITSKIDTVKIDPKHYKVVLENDQVRVIRAQRGAHESVPMHEHSLYYVSVFLTDQNMRSLNPDGTVTVLRRKTGDVIWGTPHTHQEDNLNSAPFEVVMVEIKD